MSSRQVPRDAVATEVEAHARGMTGADSMPTCTLSNENHDNKPQFIRMDARGNLARAQNSNFVWRQQQRVAAATAACAARPGPRLPLC